MAESLGVGHHPVIDPGKPCIGSRMDEKNGVILPTVRAAR
jgi:hypothetical protein